MINCIFFLGDKVSLFFLLPCSVNLHQFSAGCLKRFNIVLGPNRNNSGRVKVDLRVPIKVLDVCR